MHKRMVEGVEGAATASRLASKNNIARAATLTGEQAKFGHPLESAEKEQALRNAIAAERQLENTPERLRSGSKPPSHWITRMWKSLTGALSRGMQRLRATFRRKSASIFPGEIDPEVVEGVQNLEKHTSSKKLKDQMAQSYKEIDQIMDEVNRQNEKIIGIAQKISGDQLEKN
ncbi:hypothetical protein PCANC_00859 [Puccinia coronata f. sp. avenae]|uniref:Uncharacterized protein n=1 Tax=Puccinia coronata f. sp. avenae TaxID=200324 RepID=A0A2N5VDK4_9BASI|nr:hypothetical protein PCANC_10345 [Puccinia coronata f. sp. avenae]PLW48088.1 hypothetical protein PCASD_03564 [Puccinia coronata f. sp. avenae]PLW58209.1 hypothetical protein PCANC_00859 [Puccinia coronata f. sp. avenae]